MSIRSGKSGSVGSRAIPSGRSSQETLEPEPRTHADYVEFTQVGAESHGLGPIGGLRRTLRDYDHGARGSSVLVAAELGLRQHATQDRLVGEPHAAIL